MKKSTLLSQTDEQRPPLLSLREIVIESLKLRLPNCRIEKEGRSLLIYPTAAARLEIEQFLALTRRKTKGHSRQRVLRPAQSSEGSPKIDAQKLRPKSRKLRAPRTTLD